jgi:hypothetical protein
MQNHNYSFKVLVVGLCFLMTNCATTSVPGDWLSKPDFVASDAYGGWIEIKSLENHIQGELIAIDEDTVFVANSTLQTIASKDILSARLVIYDAQSMGGWVLLGTLSTISHGLLLIFTTPMWLIGGTIAVVSRSYDPIIDYPQRPLVDFKAFARYPQGLPPNLDRNVIRMKK